MRIRVSGLIVREGQVALVEFRDDKKGIHYDLPGGGLESNEALHEGVRRECREEIGCEVDVGRLLLVTEYFPARDGGTYSDQPTLDLIFECVLLAEQEPHLPEIPDEDQIGAKWMPLATLAQHTFKPEVAAVLLARLRSQMSDGLWLDGWR